MLLSSILKSLIITFYVSVFLILSCSSSSNDIDEEVCKTELSVYPKEVPADLFINYKSWQYDGDDYAFDSSEGKIRKVISSQGYHVDTSMNLTKDEIKEVWRMMKDINVLGYPSVYEPPASGSMSHSPNYDLTIGYNGLTKNIKWNKNTWGYSCQEAHRLKMLMVTLDSIITNKKEFQSIHRQGRL